MSTLEKQFQEMVDLGDIPGAILTAQDISGKFKYEKAFGNRTLLDGTTKPMQVDDIMNLFSATKILTAISILQCVEKGSLSLDKDVGDVLPELANVQILTGFDEQDKPQYKDKKTAITLSLLLSHSSGLGYDMFDPQLTKWRMSRGEAPMRGNTVEERGNVPLTFEPGTNWQYGVGTDWAGKLLERTLGTTLEAYFHEHVFAPLGIADATYWPLKDEKIRARMVDLTPDDPRGVGRAGVGGHDIGNDSTDCFGGGGCYMSPRDYLKVLHSLLADDGRLLRPESVEALFRPRLPRQAHDGLNAQLSDPMLNEMMGQGPPAGSKRDYALGGMLIQESWPGCYQDGTLFWAGGLNLTWFIDRKSGLCGLGAPQWPLKEAPATRKPGEDPKPAREGGMVWEVLTSHVKQVYRKGIYEVFEEWKKSQ